MYYQNGNYMQDLNYYNQNPINYGYPTNNNYMLPMQNTNQNIPMRQMTNQNLSVMYPAVYRIIQPVVSQVLANNNSSYLTEDLLNTMVDNVYNIVEGDINLGNNAATSATQSTSENTNNSSCNRAPNNSSLNNNSANASNNRDNGSNVLLKDLIKIMILNEIVTRRQNNMNSFSINNNNIPNGNMNQNMFV